MIVSQGFAFFINTDFRLITNTYTDLENVRKLLHPVIVSEG